MKLQLFFAVLVFVQGALCAQRAPKTVPVVSDLVALPAKTLAAGFVGESAEFSALVFTEGRNAAGDAGDAVYRYTATPPTGATNECVIASGGGYFVIVPQNGQIRARQWGIMNGNTNVAQIQRWMDYCRDIGVSAYLDEQEIGVPSPDSLILKSGMSFKGNGPKSRILRMGLASTTNSHVFSLIKTAQAFNPFQTNGGFTGSNIVATVTNVSLSRLGFGTWPGYFSTFGVSLFGTEGAVVEGCDFGKFTNHWALSIFGNNTRVAANRIRNGGDIYQDGIHFIGGDGASVVGNDVEAGDDAFALTLSWKTQADIRNVTASGNIFSSTHAHSIRLDSESLNYGSNYISDVNIYATSGKAGQMKNGLVRIDSASSSIRYPIRRVAISGFNVAHGGLDGHGGTAQGAAYGFFVADADEVWISGANVFGTPWHNFHFENCGRVTLEGVTAGGAQDSFFNNSLYSDNLESLQVSDSRFFNGNGVSTDTAWLKGTVSAQLIGNLFENSKTNRGALLVYDGAQMQSAVLANNIITNRQGSAVKFVTDPVAATITGNILYAAESLSDGRAIQWQTGIQPAGIRLAANVGVYVPAVEFSYSVTNSSGAFVGSIDRGANDYLRLIATNGVIVFGANNQTTNTSEAIRLAAKSPLNQIPISIATVSDNGAFQTLTLGGGSSIVAGPRQISFSTTLTNYTAGTERMRLTSTGLRLEPSGVTGNPRASSAFQIESKSGFFTPPIMTSTERDNIIAADGDFFYNSTTGKFQGRAGGVWTDL